jgi:hypothetical protein
LAISTIHGNRTGAAPKLKRRRMEVDEHFTACHVRQLSPFPAIRPLGLPLSAFNFSDQQDLRRNPGFPISLENTSERGNSSTTFETLAGGTLRLMEVAATRCWP